MTWGRLIILLGVAGVVTLFWWILPEIAPRWTWAINRAMECLVLGLLSGLVIDRAMDYDQGENG